MWGALITDCEAQAWWDHTHTRSLSRTKQADKAVEAMSKYRGTVLKTSLSKEDEKELQDALHGGT